MLLNLKYFKEIDFETKMHKLSNKLALNKLYFLAFLFLLFPFYLGFSASKAKAQIPDPPVPCDEPRSDEFHSLRPYPANPCNKEVPATALFCGNDLIIADSFTVSEGEATSCEILANGKKRCSFTKEKGPITITVNLSEAEFPILGNTENVVSSQKEIDDTDFDDAGKMNEYVSWYLNGTINRAEYEFLSPNEKQDINKLINFSGPLNKLLPWDEQIRLRINTIEKATGYDTATDEDNLEIDRHNQIVACTIAGIPVPCYHKKWLGEVIDAKHRLSDWAEGEISIFPTLDSTWNERIPPQRKNYSIFLDYWEAYKEWRGNSCGQFTIPIINKKVLLCSPIDNPLRPNYWANLFPYIPYSSTEDRVGLVETQNYSVYPTSEDVILKEVSFINQEPAELFFAHTEEVAELAEILQKTYAPLGSENNLSPTGVSIPEYCDLVEIRTNEGDNLFAGEIQGDLKYTAEFTCEFESRTSNACEAAGGECISTPRCYRVGENTVNGGVGCNSSSETCCSRKEPSPAQECKKEIYVNLSVITKTPGVDKIWARLVAGSSAVFKRIFPKVGPNSELGCLLDIPGATKASYSGEGLVYAGNPGNERSGESAELYFSHIGGIYEYFLKGIQTLLRPKGFGENITFGPPGDPLCIQNTSSIDICSEDCNSDPTNVDMAGVKEKFEDLASRWLTTGSPRTDKYEQVVNTSLARGVDPIFTLAIWLHETGASNYLGICNEFGGGNPATLYCQKILDFGVNLEEAKTIINSSGTVITDNFDNQLSRFLNLPDFYLSACDLNTVGCAWEIYGAMYQQGICSPNDSSNGYVAGILEIYKLLSPTQQFPCYPTRLAN